MKKAILRIFIIFSCLFTACFAGFSIAMTWQVSSKQHISAIAKRFKDASTQQSQILQTPQANDAWAKKLRTDVTSFANPTQKEKITHAFSIDQTNPHKNYPKLLKVSFNTS